MQYSMRMKIQHTRDNLMQEVADCQKYKKTTCFSSIIEIIVLKIITFSSLLLVLLFFFFKVRMLQGCSASC